MEVPVTTMTEATPVRRKDHVQWETSPAFGVVTVRDAEGRVLRVIPRAELLKLTVRRRDLAVSLEPPRPPISFVARRRLTGRV